MTTHALTIDLEDWRQMFTRRITGEYGSASEATVDATHRLLDALDEANVRATFFVVGMLAERFPGLVREVHRRGHEIGSHTYSHRLIFTMTPAEFRADVSRSIAQLQDLTGSTVRGFRAPEFSVSRLGHWCFEVLAESGFAYDSSVFPIAGPRYGVEDAPREPFRMDTPAGALWEFPLATYVLRGRRVPVAGGSFHRLLPRWLLQRAIDDIDKGGASSVFYFHPYEFDAQTLRLEDLELRRKLTPGYLKYRILHNFRTPRILRGLKPMLARLEFRPLGEICSAMASSNP